MEMVLCRSCGESVVAAEADGKWIPLPAEYPACEGNEFASRTEVSSNEALNDG